MDWFSIDLDVYPSDFSLVPIYDVHFGTRLHDKRLFQRVLDVIKNDPNCYFFLGGDLAEFISHSDKRFEPDTLDPEFLANLDQLIDFSIDYIVRTFEPVKDRCLFIIGGNHDLRYYKKYGVDIVRRVAEGLGVKNYTRNYEALVSISFRPYGKNKKTWRFNIYAHHGFGGGRKKGALVNNLEDLSGYFDADIYIMGHSHQLLVTPKNVYKLNKTGTGLIVTNKLLIRVGGFRRSRGKVSSYEEERAMYPNAVGTVKIKPFFLDKPRNRLKFTAELLT